MPSPALPAVPPPFVVRWSAALGRFLQRLACRLSPPQFATVGIVSGRWVSEALGALVRLGVPEALAGGPRAVDDLAGALQVDADALRRLLRALAREGLLTEHGDRFGLTPLTDVLRADHPSTVRDVTLNATAAHNATSWAHLHDAVRTGRRVWDGLYGAEFWTWLDAHPEEGAAFHGAMAELTRDVAPAVARAYPFGRHRVVADLAGGTGTLLATLLVAHPQVRGVLVDRESVVAGAPEVLRRWAVTDRVGIVAGDAFQAPPPGADAIVAKHLLHGYDDDHAAEVLRRWRGGLPGDGRLLLVEMEVPGAGRPYLASLDLQMLVSSLGGRERTRSQWSQLLGRGGFELVAVHETASPFAVIEARPA